MRRVALGFVMACTSARAPEAAMKCPLEAAIVVEAGAETIPCGNLVSNARVDGAPDCAEKVKEAARGQRAFVAIWNQPQYDGVVLRHAVVGRASDAGYELRRFEYSLVARCGPPGNCGDRTHEAWTARSCSSLGDDLACVGAAAAGECRD